LGSGRYVAGLILGAVAVFSVALGASRLRARFLPSWRGAPAYLVDALIALALFFGVLQILGALGAFRLGFVVAACVALGAAAAAVGGRTAPAEPLDAPHPSRFLVALAVATTALLVAQFTAFTVTSLRLSIDDQDSMQYHLPIAARFAQTGRITDFHFTIPESAQWAHPDNSELLHGTGMLLFDRDIVSPLLNFGWLALIVLAAWCIGRPWGLGPLTIIGVACVLSQPVFARSSGGTAFSDLPANALLLSGIAVMLQPDRTRISIAVAGAAAGMAVGTKVTTIAPVFFLTAGVLILALRSKKRTMIVDWTVPLLVTGSFWYVRNFVRAGSPLPALELKVGPVGFPSGRFTSVDHEAHSVSDYFGDPTVWTRWFSRGLKNAFGPLWFVLLALVAIGLLIAIVKGATRVHRMLGAVGFLSAIAYLFTPGSAAGPAGEPWLFGPNLRYLGPAVLLGAALLSLAGALRNSRAAVFIAAAFITVMLATVTSDSVQAWPTRGQRVALVAAVAVLASAGLWSYRAQLAALYAGRPRVARSAVIVALAAAATVAALGGNAVADRYLRHRYTARPVWRWARTLHHKRIAISGLLAQYPLYGLDLTNHVQYVGDPGPHGAFHRTSGCREWQRALRAGRYNYVVLEPQVTFDREPDAGDPPELRWTSAMPGVTSLFAIGRSHVFLLNPSAPSGGCGN
jgi:hypothetical protein